MKKLLSFAVSLLLIGSCSLSAAAANVYVTISDEKGNLALAQKAVDVSDVDGDGAVTINDALSAAHEANYNGGAAAGYGSGLTDYGLSMNKLWGNESGSYGYYINNASAWSLTDPVKDGDYVSAYVYTDMAAWSDTYSYFDVQTKNAARGQTVTFTLSAASFDAEFNPITVPVKDAVITVNGQKTAYKTDANGSVSMKFDQIGTQMISAVSDTMTLVPPVCTVNVSESAPQTADSFSLFALLASSALLCGVIASRKKS